MPRNLAGILCMRSPGQARLHLSRGMRAVSRSRTLRHLARPRDRPLPRRRPPISAPESSGGSRHPALRSVRQRARPSNGIASKWRSADGGRQTRSAVSRRFTDLAPDHRPMRARSFINKKTPPPRPRQFAWSAPRLAETGLSVLGFGYPRSNRISSTRRKINMRLVVELPDRGQSVPLPEVRASICGRIPETGQEQGHFAEGWRRRSKNGSSAKSTSGAVNRRGYSPLVLCPHCGRLWNARNCASALSLHTLAHKWFDHYCGYTAPLPKACAHCGSDMFIPRPGFKKAEEC